MTFAIMLSRRRRFPDFASVSGAAQGNADRAIRFGQSHHRQVIQRVGGHLDVHLASDLLAACCLGRTAQREADCPTRSSPSAVFSDVTRREDIGLDGSARMTASGLGDTACADLTGRGMDYTSRAPDRESAFVSVYESTYADLLRFVRRRIGSEQAQSAEDVVAEAFLVAWRKFDDRPRTAADARPWIFGIARRLLLAHHRGTSTTQALGVELAVTQAADSTGDLDLVESQLDLARAWGLLSAVHQESLTLALLDGLTASQAAVVLDISPVAYRLRLSRARRTLRSHLDHSPQPRPLTPERARP